MGWREWIAIPTLGIDRIKAKVDTGARSSALHAFDITDARIDGREAVRFGVHPVQRTHDPVVEAIAPLVDRRQVRSSSGVPELRPVVAVTVALGGVEWEIEVTLTDRSPMGFRFLLGRQAIRRRWLVDAGRSYLQSSRKPS
jgi:hypothetical protein